MRLHQFEGAISHGLNLAAYALPFETEGRRMRHLIKLTIVSTFSFSAQAQAQENAPGINEFIPNRDPVVYAWHKTIKTDTRNEDSLCKGEGFNNSLTVDVALTPNFNVCEDYDYWYNMMLPGAEEWQRIYHRIPDKPELYPSSQTTTEINAQVGGTASVQVGGAASRSSQRSLISSNALVVSDRVSFRTLQFSRGAGLGHEIAARVEYRPIRASGLTLVAERTQRVDGIGRSGFSAFFQHTFRSASLPAGLNANGQMNGGISGSGRNWFLDTQLAVTRPLWRGVALGGGIWTSAQPGLARADIGPRLSLPAPGGARLHADYRFRVAGNAAPGSGAALTLAKDF